jgi:hypothetical protein
MDTGDYVASIIGLNTGFYIGTITDIGRGVYIQYYRLLYCLLCKSQQRRLCTKYLRHGYRPEKPVLHSWKEASLQPVSTA